MDLPTPGSPPTRVIPPGTTPPPRTLSISFPSSCDSRILGMVEPFALPPRTSRSALGGLASATQPDLTRPDLRPMPMDDASSIAELSAILATARAPAPPPELFPDDAVEGSETPRITFMESQALHPGHCPYHWFAS